MFIGYKKKIILAVDCFIITNIIIIFEVSDFLMFAKQSY
jgi:hypothetical protein